MYCTSAWRKYLHLSVEISENYQPTPPPPVPITAKVFSSKPAYGKVYSIQHYVIKVVSDLRQVRGFLRFPPPIELTATI